MSMRCYSNTATYKTVLQHCEHTPFTSQAAGSGRQRACAASLRNMHMLVSTSTRVARRGSIIHIIALWCNDHSRAPSIHEHLECILVLVLTTTITTITAPVSALLPVLLLLVPVSPSLAPRIHLLRPRG